jgi:hypothetical protein
MQMQTMQPVMGGLMVRAGRGRREKRAAARDNQQRNKSQSAL